MSQQPSAASWVKLPAAVVLVACEFLDAASLGRLEICGKSSLGDKTRAWSEKAAGVTRGNLASLSNKRLLAAQARLQALIPSSSEESAGFSHHVRRASEDVPFDEFSFTVVISSYSESDEFLTTVFPFMRLVVKRDEMDKNSNFSSFAFLPSGQGAENIAPLLREAVVASAEGADIEEFKEFHTPRAFMICTRKSDGAAVRVAFWDTDEFDEDCWSEMNLIYPGGRKCMLRFDRGELLIGHGSSSDYDYYMTLNMVFDQSNGRVIAFCSGIFHSTEDLAGSNMSNEMFYALLHARLDDSTRARPLPLSETGRRIINGDLPASETAVDVGVAHGPW